MSTSRQNWLGNTWSFWLRQTFSFLDWLSQKSAPNDSWKITNTSISMSQYEQVTIMPKSLILCTSNMNSSYSKPNSILVLLIITASIFPQRWYILPLYFRRCTRIYRGACDLSWSSNVRKANQFLLRWYASISFHSCWNESYHEHVVFILSNEFNTYS